MSAPARGIVVIGRDAGLDHHVARILKATKTIAMVGASDNPIRPSYLALTYLVDKGYRVIPVNPKLKGSAIAGMEAAGDLGEIAEPVDMVDAFRRAEDTPAIARQAVAMGAKTLWLQLGIVSAEAAEIASAAGLDVVMDRCPKIEYGRLCGDIGFMGVNRRVIDNRRKTLTRDTGALARRPIGGGKGRL